VKLSENNASAVMTALAAVGPLAINIDASAWSAYESGVFDGCSYDDMDIDHVVALVGYGTDGVSHSTQNKRINKQIKKERKKQTTMEGRKEGSEGRIGGKD
jgi:hypothetical protein